MPKKISMFLLLNIALLLFTLMAPAPVQACSCAETNSVADELNRSDVVFSGNVVNVDRGGGFFGPNRKSVKFKVSKTWKGTKQKSIIITTGFGGGDCGFEFEAGKEYLVYAIHSSTYDGKLTTGICDRTTELSAAAEDLIILGEGDEPTIESKPESKFANGYLWGSIILGLGILGYLIWRKNRGAQN
ncbi:hypothetical protein [Alkalihalobacillus sp. AL-G]|uniref:hypothetical protein n=1 Tax=Alkalihalobacillus sp. AL-G TaxID=2926399 RepID=UPI00272A274B|nr:hypothetical protein [Alkalihalobacillus sp. AL-G]WLD94311.1 hypothetical protein MOJ78_05305 [Alkalihalobacillus sp. AL-G]